MNKDVIYIDTEDDITAIIGKIKDSKEKVVALVPPKRVGILQSAVNLRLLARMADSNDKRIVLVTNNKALMNLSTVAKIPVARNLQSKPEMAEIDVLEIDDGEDIIEGKQLPIGELVRTADLTEKGEVAEAINTIDVEQENPKIIPKTFQKSDIKIPDFSRFRKRLFIGILLAIALAGFLVWAIIFAPSATVIITAKTSLAPISLSVKLGGTAVTDASKNIIQTISKQIQKNVSVTFTATGQQNVGNKATGTMAVTRISISSNPLLVPVGTLFTSGDNVFSSTEEVTLAPTTVGPDGPIQDSANVAVIATVAGEANNVTARSYQASLSGIDAYGSDMTGGTTKMSTVVTADDVQKASQALADLSSDSVRSQLIAEFTSGEYVLGDTFTVVHAAAVSVPAIGAEATGKVTLTSPTTFSVSAITKTEIETYLKSELNKQIAGKNQRIYNDGIDNVKLVSPDQGVTVNISASGQVGPNINDATIKQQIKGKQFGDTQALLSSIDGVNNVDIKFSYFWVTNLPADVNKIDVQFILQNV